MEQYKYFLQDLILLLKERIEAAMLESAKEDMYDKGWRMGLYEVLSLIKSQAIAFNIPLADIGLDDYPLEKLLE